MTSTRELREWIIQRVRNVGLVMSCNTKIFRPRKVG
jgi:hypothetical protein